MTFGWNWRLGWGWDSGLGLGTWIGDWGLGLGIKIGIRIGDCFDEKDKIDTTLAYLGYSFYYAFLRVVWLLDY